MIHVVAAVLRDSSGRVLLAKRPEGSHQGGLWEFPGGKLEPGELPTQALLRELEEELGISPSVVRPLIQVQHAYPDRKILLDVFLVTAWSGQPVGLENQPLAWVPTEQLNLYPMPEADKPVLLAIRLPALHLITPPACTNQSWLFDRLRSALSASPAMLQFRMDAGQPVRARIAASLLDICRQHGAPFLVNSDPVLASEIGATGLHLNSGMLRQCSSRPDFPLVGASCHNAQELALAERLGLDYALLSPVLLTQSHPGVPTLGWDEFSKLVASARLPVYGLGGLGHRQLNQAWLSGAQGVAGINFWLNDADIDLKGDVVI